MNRGIRVLQTLALPLGHVTIFGATAAAPFGAADEARTRYLHLGKVALYQMSYGRILETLLGLLTGASDRNRTNDTGIFSPLLYQLSYLGKSFPRRTAREGNCNPKGTHEMELHLVGDGDPERARTVDL